MNSSQQLTVQVWGLRSFCFGFISLILSVFLSVRVCSKTPRSLSLSYFSCCFPIFFFLSLSLLTALSPVPSLKGSLSISASNISSCFSVETGCDITWITPSGKLTFSLPVYVCLCVLLQVFPGDRHMLPESQNCSVSSVLFCLFFTYVGCLLPSHLSAPASVCAGYICIVSL